MRSHYWQFLINAEGQPIQDANISVYEANSTTPAGIYQGEYGGSIINTVPQFSTTPEGYFEFWVDTNDYAGDIKFKIAWDKIGISSGFIDFVDVFYTLAVDETDVDILKNKTVSNYLAWLWEEHRLYNDIIDDVTSVHGIYSVNLSGGNTDKNKLISNSIAKTWQDHLIVPAVSGAHGLEPVDELNVDPIYNKLLCNSLAKIWQDHVDAVVSGSSPHGLLQVDENDTDIIYNKLLSNVLAKEWNDHVTSGGTLIDGSRPFTGTVSGITPAASGDLATKDYVDSAVVSAAPGSGFTLVDGSRPFTGTVGGITPAASGDLATKDYVDSVSSSGSSNLGNDEWMKGENYANTGFVNILKVNTDDEIVMGGTLHSGSIEASENSGAVVLFDMPVSTSAASGTEESVSIKIDGDIVIKCYSTSDGAGGIENKTLKVEDVLNIKPGSAPSSPNKGDIYMDSSDDILKCYNGTIWKGLFS